MTDVARPLPPVFALHRYFLQANIMRVRYDERLESEHVAAVDDDAFTSQWIDLCLWYGCLYVVVEGWQKLGLHSAHVDPLLETDAGTRYVGLLRRLRNGVVHFQPNYWDARLVDFMGEGAASATWARNLNSAFGRFFLEWLHQEQDARTASASETAPRPS